MARKRRKKSSKSLLNPSGSLKGIRKLRALMKKANLKIKKSVGM